MGENRDSGDRLRILRLSLPAEISHGLAVSELSVRVARKLGLSDEVCHDLAIAGFLHDIGKLQLRRMIDDQQSQPLVIEELKAVRMHADLSAKILREKGYPEHICHWVHCHHENCDGSGYPCNLVREQIPFEARIIRVCDVFAALTARRPYREAFEPEAAAAAMIEEIKYYDMKVFLAFLQVIHGDDLEKILDSRERREHIAALLEEKTEE